MRLVSSIAVSLSLVGGSALAADKGCTSVAKLKERGGEWSAAIPRAQAIFLSGVFAMNPLTHPGLPDGDKVFIVTLGDTSLIVWTDEGEKLSCDVMPGAKTLLEMLPKVGKGGGDDL